MHARTSARRAQKKARAFFARRKPTARVFCQQWKAPIDFHQRANRGMRDLLFVQVRITVYIAEVGVLHADIVCADFFGGLKKNRNSLFNNFHAQTIHFVLYKHAF
jgi:hypothetical protein